MSDLYRVEGVEGEIVVSDGLTRHVYKPRSGVIAHARAEHVGAILGAFPTATATPAADSGTPSGQPDNDPPADPAAG